MKLFTRFGVAGGWIVALSCLAGCKSSSSVEGSKVVNAQPSDGAPAAAGSGSGAPAQWTGTQTVSIQDPAYNISAATLEIPKGWKWRGVIARTGGCHTTGPAVDFTAESPDGTTAVIQLPGVMWTTVVSGSVPPAVTGNCPPPRVQTPAEFLLHVAVPLLHADAVVEQVLPLPPEGEASLKKQIASLEQQAQSMPNLATHNISLTGARVRLAFTLQGKDVEEMITAVVNCSDHTMPTGVLRVASPPVTRQCTERGTNIVRAPKGQLDAVLNSAAIKNQLASVKVNPEWTQKIQQEQVAKFQHLEDQLNGTFQSFMRQNQQQFDQEIANDRAQDAQREASTQHAMAADRANQNAIDYAAHQQVNVSLGRRDYTDPTTGRTVTLSNEFDHQWISNDGQTVVGTQGPGFDPNRELPFQGPFTELVPQ